jgi:ribose-phosphate pyrophosphokinase
MTSAGPVVYTASGDLPFERFTFPDGQPHVKLLHVPDPGAYRAATIEATLRTPADVFEVCLLADVLRAQGFSASLDIRYLMGARMDRPIDGLSPFTLRVVTSQLLACGFKRIRVLDAHSEVALKLLGATNVLPHVVVDNILARWDTESSVAVAPDKGALHRVRQLAGSRKFHVRAGNKHRSSATGALGGFTVEDPTFLAHKACLIIDDICDGGGTFTGLANVLRVHGALSVDLFVTHGLFTKGLPLLGIDTVYTTDTVCNPDTWDVTSMRRPIVFPIAMRGL